MNWETFPGTAADPKTKECDWCGKTASKSYELKRNRKKMGTAMYLYACNDHHQQAQEAADGYKAPKKQVEQARIEQ